MAKLPLGVDNRVVSRAKQYAKLRGVSVSQMVEAYLGAVVDPGAPASGGAPGFTFGAGNSQKRGSRRVPEASGDEISMKRILFDTKVVVLDVLLDRQPYVEISAAVWAAVEGVAERPRVVSTS